MTRVLIIDDEAVLARTIASYLRKRGFDATHAITARDGIAEFSDEPPDLTFLDYRLGDCDGLEVLARLKAIRPASPVIMMTGHGDIGVAVDAMKAGAADFLTKPAPLSRIAELAAEFGGASEHSRTLSADGSLAELVGRSPPMDALRASIRRIVDAVRPLAADPPSVLICGETGTGKEMVARALHRSGPRAAAPMVTVNCAALPPHLVEAELFGHARGAFTGADAEKPGLFEAADGGVLFLDEVAELPMDTQAKLLRVLEDRRVRRIGTVADRPVDVWVISATNRLLSDHVRAGRFRADLMYRLQVLHVDVPPLRNRDSDILLLAGHFLAEQARRYGRRPPALSAEARAVLVGHDWPGNVRELRNLLERAIVATPGDVIHAADIRLSTDPESPAAPAHGTLHDMERTALSRALVKTSGNVSRAAGLLGITRDTLRYRMGKYGLRT